MITESITNGKCKFSIVQKITEFFKLGEAGKLDSFFSRIDKTLSRDIAAYKVNLTTLKFNHDTNVSELEDQLEDANDGLQDAYMSVDLEKIKTNEAQVLFQDIYLATLDAAELKYTSIEKKIVKIKEQYILDAKNIQDNIDKLEVRLSKLK